MPPPDGGVFHLFVIQTDARDALKVYLADQGIATGVHYPVPPHLQAPYAASVDLPRTEGLAQRVLSLPMYPELSEDSVDYVARAIGAYGA